VGLQADAGEGQGEPPGPGFKKLKRGRQKLTAPQGDIRY
jgi:hypothetical protein